MSNSTLLSGELRLKAAAARWMPRMAAIWAALLLLLIGALWFAAAATGARGFERTPEYAVRPPTEHIPAGLTSTSSGDAVALLLVLLHRPDVPSIIGDLLLGVLVWIPSVFGFIASHLERQVCRYPFLLALAAFLCGILTMVDGDWMVAVAILVLIAAVGLGWHRWSRQEAEYRREHASEFDRVMFFGLTLFVFFAAASSATSHRLYTEYRGFAPVLFLNDTDRTALASALEQNADDPERVLEQISQLRGLDEWSDQLQIFVRNRYAVNGALFTGLAFLLIWAASYFHRSENIAIHFRLSFVLFFYIAVGAIFGLRFYSTYVCEAGRQNALAVSATALQIPPQKLPDLRAWFGKSGWSNRLESEIEQLRRGSADAARSGRSLETAVSRYWTELVITQDRPIFSFDPAAPRVRNDASRVMTLGDMMYFSFVSFTTTGYGDIRPVSDDLRFFVVIENIAEILFTSLFFVIVMKGGEKKT